MTFRIDQVPTAQGLVLRISGRLSMEDLNVVRTALGGRRVVAIELADVELVDRDTVQLLAQTEAEGIELRSCPAYIREWITKQRECS